MNISISVNSNTGDINSLVQKITERLPQAIMAGAEAVADTARAFVPSRCGQRLSHGVPWNAKFIIVFL